MHIRERKRNKGTVYQAQVSVPGGCPLTKTFRRRFDARQWGLEMEHRKLVADLPKQKKDIAFDDYVCEWFRTHCSVSIMPSTRARYLGIINGYLVPFFKKTLLRSIDHAKLLAFRERVFSKRFKNASQISPASVNRILEVLRKLLNDAVQCEYIDRNPLNAGLFLAEQENDIEFWETTEVRQFLDSVKESPMAVLYDVALYTGVRKGELFALKPSDFNFVRRQMVVRRNFSFVTRKAVDWTKGKTIRIIELNHEIVHEVEMACMKAVESGWEFLFFPSEDAIPRSSTFDKRYFLKDMKISGVRRIRFHDLRHTYASNFVMAGGSLYVLQKNLGHKDYKTTQCYSHLTRSHLEEQANILSFKRITEKPATKILTFPS